MFFVLVGSDVGKRSASEVQLKFQVCFVKLMLFDFLNFSFRPCQMGIKKSPLHKLLGLTEMFMHVFSTFFFGHIGSCNEC